jgi:hypothetical protein
MEAVRISETSVDNHFTRQYIPEDNSEHIITFSSSYFLASEIGHISQTINYMYTLDIVRRPRRALSGFQFSLTTKCTAEMHIHVSLRAQKKRRDGLRYRWIERGMLLVTVQNSIPCTRKWRICIEGHWFYLQATLWSVSGKEQIYFWFI